jgi:hypothetical protein
MGEHLETGVEVPLPGNNDSSMVTRPHLTNTEIWAKRTTPLIRCDRNCLIIHTSYPHPVPILHFKHKAQVCALKRGLNAHFAVSYGKPKNKSPFSTLYSLSGYWDWVLDPTYGAPGVQTSGLEPQFTSTPNWLAKTSHMTSPKGPETTVLPCAWRELNLLNSCQPPSSISMVWGWRTTG